MPRPVQYFPGNDEAVIRELVHALNRVLTQDAELDGTVLEDGSVGGDAIDAALFVRRDGTVALTGNWDAGAFSISLQGVLTAASLITGGNIGVAGDADLLQLAANILKLNGSLGIGTAAPTGPLGFGTAANAKTVLLYEDAGNKIYYGSGIAAYEHRIFAPSAAGARVVFGSISTADGTTWSEKVRIETDTGDVGIGTTPDERFHAAGNAAFDGQEYSGLHDDGNSGAADTIDWNNGNSHYSTLTGDCTYTFSNPKSGAKYLLYLKQDGTGSRDVVWPGTVLWPGGTPPVLSNAAGAIDVVTFVYEGVNSKYHGVGFAKGMTV